VLGRFIERGQDLSGGQRQLVALARAFMRGAPILILDEPSAALDTQNEMRLLQSLLRTSRATGQTVIFISHRFSTVRQADRILVVEEGQIVEDGTHTNLLARQGRYAELFTTGCSCAGGTRAVQAANRATLLCPDIR
jgi:ATP-binding cassette subfamily B protein